jgi:hypothetical protein
VSNTEGYKIAGESVSDAVGREFGRLIAERDRLVARDWLRDLDQTGPTDTNVLRHIGLSDLADLIDQSRGELAMAEAGAAGIRRRRP